MIIDFFSRFRSPFARVGMAIALGIMALAAVAGQARANGVPVLVPLSYIDLSNWGPEDATGEAELIFAEGIIRIRAEGMDRLTGSEYHAWLVNSEVGDAIAAGRFNAAADGSVNFEGTLPPIADFGFDLVIITVEPQPDDAPQPTQDRSIGGYFSLVGTPAADGVGADSASGGLQAPGTLPNTGDAGFMTDIVRVSALAMAMSLSIVVGLRLGRRNA